MSNKPKARPSARQSASPLASPDARPEDLPTPDGLDLQPDVHMAMDLEDLEQATRPRSQAVDLPLADANEVDTEELDQDRAFVLLDPSGLPVPGVSATPMPAGSRNIDTSPSEAALRDWRLRAPSRKAEALETERQQSLVRILQGSAALMALLLVTSIAGVRWWRAHQTAAPAPAPAPLALASPSPISPPAQAKPVAPVKEAAEPIAPNTRVDPMPPTAVTPTAGTPQVSLTQDTMRHWTGQDDYLYWQWDYVGAEPLDLQWRDANGDLRIQDRVCDGRIDAATGRCYVGRSNARFQIELDRGAAPGAWTLESCLNGDCSVVSTFEMPAGA
ncbi:MAG: hypothetical protein ACI9VR_000913 [Cognaticolwellia sp.]|jgi:hypothetical protein